MPYDAKEYYQKVRLYRIQKALEAYYDNREQRIAYQKEYTARRRAAGWRQKNYKKPKVKPEPRVILVRVPDEIEFIPEPPVTQSKRVKPPPPPPFTWKEASFSMTLD